MPSYTFKRAPSNVGDYKLITDGDKYTFFGTFGTTKTMGSVVNYGVARNILQASGGWSGITEATYESKKSQLSGDLSQTPREIYGDSVQYFIYEETVFAIVKKSAWFSETVNYSEGRQEYSVVQNTSIPYVQALDTFLMNSADKIDVGMYEKIRTGAYENSISEATAGDVRPPIDAFG